MRIIHTWCNGIFYMERAIILIKLAYFEGRVYSRVHTHTIKCIKCT